METSNKVVEVINVLCEKLGIAIDWTSENIMPHLEQLCGKYVQYELWTSVFWIVFCVLFAVIFFVVALIVGKRCGREDINWNSYHPLPWVTVVAWILCACFAIGFIFVFAIEAQDIIACLTCPEKVVLDYILKMINSGS